MKLLDFHLTPSKERHDDVTQLQVQGKSGRGSCTRILIDSKLHFGHTVGVVIRLGWAKPLRFLVIGGVL
jgi:hypothetical protein